MARSYVREARRRVGPKRERIVPIVERLLAEHPDAEELAGWLLEPEDPDEVSAYFESIA